MVEKMKNTYPWKPADFLKIILLLVIFIFLYSFLGAVFSIIFPFGGKLLDNLFPYIFNFLMLLAVYQIFIRRYRLDLGRLWGRRPSFCLIFVLIFVQSLVIGLYLFGSLLPFVPVFISSLLEILPIIPLFFKPILVIKILPRLADFSFLADSFLSVTISPFWEELFFRGILQNYFSQKTKAWLAILLTSLIFGLFHFSFRSGIDLGFYNAFLGSLFTGYFYYRTRSLSLAFILHAANNFSIVLLRLFV